MFSIDDMCHLVIGIHMIMIHSINYLWFCTILLILMFSLMLLNLSPNNQLIRLYNLGLPTRFIINWLNIAIQIIGAIAFLIYLHIHGMFITFNLCYIMVCIYLSIYLSYSLARVALDKYINKYTGYESHIWR